MRYIQAVLIVLVCLLSYDDALKGQTPALVQYTKLEGLTSNTIYQITSCNRGFLWLATENGLCRFNGQQFKRMNITGLELEDNIIIRLKAQSDTLAFLNLNGRLVLIDYTGRLIANIKLPNQKITEFEFSGSTKIWVKLWPESHSTTLHQLELPSGKILQTIVLPTSSQLPTSFPASLDSMALYFGLTDGFLGLNQAGNRRLHYHFLSNRPYLPALSTTVHLIARDSLILVRSTTGLRDSQSRVFLYTNQEVQELKLAANHGRILSLYRYRTDKILLGTEQGAYLYDIGDVKHWRLEDSLLAQAVSSIWATKGGDIWLGTLQMGLYKWEAKAARVFSGLSQTGGGMPLCTQDSSSVVYWTAQHLVQLYEDGRQVLSPLAYPLVPQQVFYQAGEYYLLNNQSFVRYKPSDSAERFKTYYFNQNKNKPLYNVKTMAWVRSGLFWVGNHRAVYQVSEDKTTLRTDIQAVLEDRCHALAYDSSQNCLWMGTERGLYHLKPGAKPQRFEDDQGQQFHSFISCLRLNSKGELLIGTKGKGLWFLAGGCLEPLYSASYEVQSIIDLLCQAEYCWVLAEEGLFELNLPHKRWRKMPLQPAPPLSLAKTAQKLWVTTANAILQYPLTPLQADSQNLALFIERIEAGGQELQQSPSLEVLEVNVKSIIFYLSAACFSQKLTYQYRINQGVWQTSEEPVVLLSNLASGSYEVQFRTLLEDGSTGRPEMFKFNIPAPFWKTPIFLSFILFVSVLITYWLTKLLYQRHLRQVQTKKEADMLKKEIIDLQIKALRAQINPHFVFNAMNAIQHLILCAKEQEAVRYLADFAKLIRQAFEGLTENMCSLNEELEFLQRYLSLEKLRFQDKLSVSLSVEPQINPNLIAIPSMIIQPFIENAFAHGLLHRPEAGSLQIHLSQDESKKILICSIEDNGVGRQKAEELAQWRQEYRPSGLSLTNRRLELTAKRLGNPHAKLTIIDLYDEENLKPRGTRVVLQLPYQIVNE